MMPAPRNVTPEGIANAIETSRFATGRLRSGDDVFVLQRADNAMLYAIPRRPGLIAAVLRDNPGDVIVSFQSARLIALGPDCSWHEFGRA